MSSEVYTTLTAPRQLDGFYTAHAGYIQAGDNELVKLSSRVQNNEDTTANAIDTLAVATDTNAETTAWLRGFNPIALRRPRMSGMQTQYDFRIRYAATAAGVTNWSAAPWWGCAALAAEGEPALAPEGEDPAQHKYMAWHILNGSFNTPTSMTTAVETLARTLPAEIELRVVDWEALAVSGGALFPTHPTIGAGPTAGEESAPLWFANHITAGGYDFFLNAAEERSFVDATVLGTRKGGSDGLTPMVGRHRLRAELLWPTDGEITRVKYPHKVGRPEPSRDNTTISAVAGGLFAAVRAFVPGADEAFGAIEMVGAVANGVIQNLSATDLDDTAAAPTPQGQVDRLNTSVQGASGAGDEAVVHTLLDRASFFHTAADTYSADRRTVEGPGDAAPGYETPPIVSTLVSTTDPAVVYLDAGFGGGSFEFGALATTLYYPRMRFTTSEWWRRHISQIPAPVGTPPIGHRAGELWSDRADGLCQMGTARRLGEPGLVWLSTIDGAGAAATYSNTMTAVVPGTDQSLGVYPTTYALHENALGAPHPSDNGFEERIRVQYALNIPAELLATTSVPAGPDDGAAGDEMAAAPGLYTFGAASGTPGAIDGDFWRQADRIHPRWNCINIRFKDSNSPTGFTRWHPYAIFALGPGGARQWFVSSYSLHE